MASNAATLKRSESIADSMPEALRQSRYHMKRCFAKYTEKGKRLMKLDHLMGEMEQVIDDKAERTQLLEGLLGYILCTTQVTIQRLTFDSIFFFFFFLHIVLAPINLLKLHICRKQQLFLHMSRLLSGRLPDSGSTLK